jgi:hypothetical protein
LESLGVDFGWNVLVYGREVEKSKQMGEAISSFKVNASYLQGIRRDRANNPRVKGAATVVQSDASLSLSLCAKKSTQKQVWETLS